MLNEGRPLKRILIIDDEPAMGRLIHKVAEGCGYDATTTNDPDDFLEELIATDPDAVVLDLSLPDIDGIELLRFMGASKCRAKILIVSGFDPRVLETSGRFGAASGLNIAGTIMKPVRLAELRAAIGALHQAAPV